MAQHTDPLSGARYPDDNEPPSIAQFIQNAVNDLSSRVVPRFATAAARTTAYANWVAAGNSMVSGLTCFTQSDGRYWRYDTTSSSWLYAGGNPPPIVAASAGSGWNTAAGRVPGVFRDSSGMVNLVGAVTAGSTYSPQDALTHTVLQVPSGYWPAITTTVVVPVPSAGLIAMGQISSSDGILRIISGTASVTVQTTWLHYLDGIRYHPTYAGSALP